jgi:adenylate cyclase
MADVFVSYARTDRHRVAPLVASIEARGWSVWWDPAIAPGEEFDRQIDAELKRCAVVLVVWTPESVRSRWVRGEARDGADRGMLVPVRFDGAELPIDFRALHTTDLDEWSRDQRSPQVQEVLRALDAMIGRQRAAAAATSEGRATDTRAAGPVAPVPVTTTAAAEAEAPRISICVLPFVNMSGDPAQEFFSDGLTEDIITELSRFRRLLTVRSRSASSRYRGVAVDMKQVARELDVRYIVEGSIRRLGDRVRITAQLIDAESGSHVWAEKFDRGQEEIFAVQDKVVQTIVSTLVGRVQATGAERARRKPPASLAAYECVLQGNALAWDDPQEAEQARKLFEQAIALDPNYAIAHSLLAALCYARWRDETGTSTATLDEAYACAKRAVELDDGDSTCQAIMGHVCLLRRSFELALQYVRRAVEINPNNQWNAADLGAVLVYVGSPEEALAWFARAREIDPYFDPAWYWRDLAQAYMRLGRYADAVLMLGHMRVRAWRASALLAACHAELGDRERAAAGVAECLAKRPGFSIAALMGKEPFRDPEDAARIAASLRLAGFAE